MSPSTPLCIRVLGCSGGIVAGQHTTSFLVENDLLIDAGTGVASLTLDEMLRIDHVVLTHAHMDHILCLPLLLDVTGPLRNTPVQVHALPETIAALRQHIFNDHIWPDFSVLPAGKPYMKLLPLNCGEIRQIAGKRVEALPAHHSVPAIGLAVSRAQTLASPCWVFSGDTGPCDAFWERLNALPVGILVMETAFSDEEVMLARISGHQSPAALMAELTQLSLHQSFPIYITHTKPSEVERIMGQLECGNRQRAVPLDVRRLNIGDRLVV